MVAEILTPEAIASRNDAFRATFPYVKRPNVLTVTAGVAAAFPNVLPVVEAVKQFNTFTEDNDPHKEHDFGSFHFGGEKLFWKIDDYNGHDGFNLVCTVMLAEEY